MKTTTKAKSTKITETVTEVTMPNKVYCHSADGTFHSELLAFANKHSGGSIRNLTVTPNANLDLKTFAETGTGLYPSSYKQGNIDYTVNNGYMLAMFAVGCPIVDGVPYSLSHPKFKELGKINLSKWLFDGKPTTNNLHDIVVGQRVGGHPVPAWRVIGQALNGACGTKHDNASHPCITITVKPTVKK